MDNVDTREERLRELYSLIRNNKIGIKFRGNNQVTFGIEKDAKIIELSVVKSVTRYRVDEILIQGRNVVISDRFTPKDEGYSLWKNLLQKSQSDDIELIETRGVKKTGLYNGKVFLNSILPSLDKALNPKAVGRFSSANSKHNHRFVNDTELARLQIQRERGLGATSTSTQLINEVSSTTVDTTTELFDFTTSKKAEEEHLESTTQEIDGSTVSPRFCPRQNIPGILSYNNTEGATSMPKLEGAGGSSLAAAISLGILLGLIGLVVLVGLGAAYYMRKRSGSYNANKTPTMD